MLKSPDLLLLKEQLDTMFPFCTESKPRFDREFFNPPMIPILKQFFKRNKAMDDLRIELDSEKFSIPDQSYKKFQLKFPYLAEEVSVKEWQEGMKDGLKLKKWAQNRLLPDVLNKSQKNDAFDKYYLTKWETCLALKSSGKSDVKIIISKNPIDFWFCSATDSFESCLDVSKERWGQQHGLINVINDPARFMVMVTKGSRYLMWGGKLHIIPNIISRTWGHITETGQLTTVRWFNGEAISDKALAGIMNVKSGGVRDRTAGYIPYSMKYGSTRGRHIPMIYVDDGGLNVTDNNKLYIDYNDGHHGIMINQFVKDVKGNIVRNLKTIIADPPFTDTRVKLNLYENCLNEKLTCHCCGKHFTTDPYSGHKCPKDKLVNFTVKSDEEKTTESFFGPTTEKVYVVTSEKKQKLNFPRSKVVEFLKQGHVEIKNNRLYLKGVA